MRFALAKWLAGLLIFAGAAFAVGPPTSITAVVAPQSEPVGFQFSLAALVKDATGNPVPGVSVTFSAPNTGPSGAFSNGAHSIMVTTQAGKGDADAFLTANQIPGSYNVSASILTASGVVTATFSLTNIGPPSSITPAPGNSPQSAQIGAVFPTALSAIVKDAAGDPISGISVTFSAPTNGPSGTFMANASRTITVTSNTSGIALAPFAANLVAGSYNVTAFALTASGGITGTFLLTNLGPASITANAGTTPQTALVGTSFQPLIVNVRDALNAAMPQIAVDFAAPHSGPSGTFKPGVTEQTLPTDFAGNAMVSFQANSIAGGPYIVTAMAGAVSATFSLTNSGPPVSMTPSPGSTPQTTRAGTRFPQSLLVTLKDAANHTPAPTSIVFTAPSSGPSGAFPNGLTSDTILSSVVSDSGFSFQANDISGGPYMVTAAAGALTATFSLTNQGPPTSITAGPGATPQSAAIGAAFANPLAVTVKDQTLLGVPGVVVTFTAPSSGASGVFGNSASTIQVTTDASGTASAPVKANQLAGSYTVQASTPAGSGSGLLSTTFSLTNSGAAPVITQNPADLTVSPGATAAFTAAATGSPTLTVQWQQTTNSGATFTDIAGATATTLTFTANAAQNGTQFRAVFSNSVSTAATTLATLTVKTGPVIRAVSPVIPSFLGNAGFSSNMYLEIYGSNFSTTTRQWSGSDFTGPLAPTSLEHVSVKVNNKPAFVYFISPGQININAPDDDATSLVSVQVSTPGGDSNIVTVQRSRISPTLQTTPQFNVGGKQYVVALTPDFSSFIGPPNLIPGASFATRRPGDIISIYALGAGPTNPPTQAGNIAAVNSPMALPFQLKIGGVQANTTFAGLLANTIGLYQLNVVIPQVAPGDQPIEFIVDGVPNNQNLFLTVGP